MVKLFSLFLVFFSLSYSDDFSLEDTQDSLADRTFEVQRDPLIEKIKTFVELDVYENNQKYIDIVFSPREEFFKGNTIDVVKVVATLKDNGLLKLFFNKPKELNLHFKTSGSPLFFVKLMSDSLRNIGYYRYVTTSSNFNNTEFTWSISLTSEYATDPLVLQKELMKSGCKIIDINRTSSTQWTYRVEMKNGFLNVQKLQDHQKVKLKRSMYSHWLNVSNMEVITIATSRRNSWYPYIAYYDKSLNLLKVIRRDRRSKRITIKVPSQAKYMKISDIYTLKNVTEDLVLYPRSNRFSTHK